MIDSFGVYSEKAVIRLWKITENFDVLTLVVKSDRKKIRHTMRRIWVFCESVSPLYGKGDLLPSEGIEEGSTDLELMQMMIRTHEMVEMMPIKVR